MITRDVKSSSTNAINSKNAPPGTDAKTVHASLLIHVLRIRVPEQSLPAVLTAPLIMYVPAHQPPAAAESIVPKTPVSTAPKARAVTAPPEKSPTDPADAMLLRIRVRLIRVLLRHQTVQILRGRRCAGVRLRRVERAGFVRADRVRSVRRENVAIVLRDMKRTVRADAGLRTSVWE